MNVAFPLRDGFFKPLQCTREDERRWKQLMAGLLTRTLHEERPYFASQYTFVDGMRWKLLKEKDQLHVYQARRSFLGRSNSQNVLAIGTIEGTLEDVIYGIHATTTTDMRATCSFLRDNALDAAVLHVLETGNDHDPYRSLAVKWRVVETPGGGLVANRDGCVLEYMGIDTDDKGQRYAFHITENFEHDACPPFKSRCAVRAKAQSRILYRQLSPTRVGVYLKGEYDMGGKIPGSLARRISAEMAIGIASTVACTEAKKLTALALRTSPIFHHELRAFLATLRSACSICTAKARYLLSTKSMTWCKVCGAPVCSKCRSRKYLLSDDKKIRISCCKQCLVAAKQEYVDPTQPLRLISAGQWLSLLQNQQNNASSSSGAHQTGHGAGHSFGSSGTRSHTGGASLLSMTSSSTHALSIHDFDAFLTPMSSTTSNSSASYGDLEEDHVALLECSDMASVLEEEGDEDDDVDEIPTLGEMRFEFNRKVSIDDDLLVVKPPFTRSAVTPAVTKSDAQAAIHREDDRMSLYSQMRRLREQAEDVYSLTQANGWEIMGAKTSTSSFSSMRSTAVMSTASYASTAHSHPSIG